MCSFFSLPSGDGARNCISSQAIRFLFFFAPPSTPAVYILPSRRSDEEEEKKIGLETIVDKLLWSILASINTVCDYIFSDDK